MVKNLDMTCSLEARDVCSDSPDSAVRVLTSGGQLYMPPKLRFRSKHRFLAPLPVHGFCPVIGQNLDMTCSLEARDVCSDSPDNVVRVLTSGGQLYMPQMRFKLGFLDCSFHGTATVVVLVDLVQGGGCVRHKLWSLIHDSTLQFGEFPLGVRYLVSGA